MGTAPPSAPFKWVSGHPRVKGAGAGQQPMEVSLVTPVNSAGHFAAICLVLVTKVTWFSLIVFDLLALGREGLSGVR